jgi:hypothetical protein
MMPNLPNLTKRLANLSYTPTEIVAADKQIAAMRRLMSADATFYALLESVKRLTKSAPKDHDILVQAFGISITQVQYAGPHTLVFEGFNDEGNTSFVVCHFSQLIAHVIFTPKRGPSRVITGFAGAPSD